MHICKDEKEENNLSPKEKGAQTGSTCQRKNLKPFLSGFTNTLDDAQTLYVDFSVLFLEYLMPSSCYRSNGKTEDLIPLALDIVRSLLPSNRQDKYQLQQVFGYWHQNFADSQVKDSCNDKDYVSLPQQKSLSFKCLAKLDYMACFVFYTTD